MFDSWFLISISKVMFLNFSNELKFESFDSKSLHRHSNAFINVPLKVIVTTTRLLFHSIITGLILFSLFFSFKFLQNH